MEELAKKVGLAILALSLISTIIVAVASCFVEIDPAGPALLLIIAFGGAAMYYN